MKTTIIGLILTSILGTVAFHFYTENQVLSYQITEKAQQIKDILNTHEVRIDMLEYEVVDSLAKECETKGVKEPDAAIILDSNEQMSLGAWMWQIKSVQHYVKLFEDRDINRVEAIQIAIDHNKARELTRKVIFEDEKGVWNWANCAKKLDLEAQVKLIKKLKTQ